MARMIAIMALVIAGITHFTITPSHYAHAPAHGIFFGISGAAQLAAALLLYIRPNRGTYYFGLGASGGLIILWLLTQIWSPPFAAVAEAIDLPTILSKLAELVAFGSLIAFANSADFATFAGNKTPNLALEAVGLALLVGVGSFGGGYASEPMFPSLYHAGDDHHEDDAHGHDDAIDDHHEDEDDDDHHADEEDADDDHHADEDGHSNDDGHHDE